MAVNVTFSGGDKLRAALEQLQRKVQDGAHVRVGFFEGATYPDGTPVAQIAAIQEFGATIDVESREQTIYRAIDAKGDFKKGGRFVKKAKSNFATTHDVGAHTVIIPPRPFMRETIASHSHGWGKLLGTALEVANFNVKVALGVTGRAIADQMRDTISRISPPNAPSTVKKKGFNTPLVDTGRLRNSIQHEVRDD